MRWTNHGTSYIPDRRDKNFRVTVPTSTMVSVVSAESLVAICAFHGFVEDSGTDFADKPVKYGILKLSNKF